MNDSNKSPSTSSAIDREVERYGDVSGYRGSRYARGGAGVSVPSQMEQIKEVPLTLPTAAFGASKLVPRYRVEGGGNAAASSGASDQAAGKTYTFTACVSGVPKNFDVFILRGPY